MKNQFRKKEPVSILFVISFLAFILFLIFYITSPNKLDGTKGKKSFEELLEYKTDNKINTKKVVNHSIENNNINSIVNDIKPSIQTKNSSQPVFIDKTKLYNDLLDELSVYPSKSEFFVNLAVNKLLNFKGYPENTLKIIISDMNSPASKSMNSFMLANFNFLNGELNISQKLLYELDVKIIIAVLAHEIDHFDKFAKLCKFLGVENFNKIFTDNNINNLNVEFWSNASSFANIDNFDADFYKNGLKRFLNQKSIEQVSSYADFYRLAENIRNPLEVSAYKESDYVYNHFNIPVVEGEMKRLSRIFNEIDKNIDKIINSNNYIRQEKTAVFDYIYALSIIDVIPELSSEYNYCKNNLNGDLTSFWLAFETKFSDFYKHKQMTQQTINDIFKVLNTANEKSKKSITLNEIALALQYKINTLKSNLVYKNAVKNLRNTVVNYLYFLKNENINNPNQELNAILLLICIDNQIFKNNQNSEISLLDIKIPENIINLYRIQKQNRKFLFLYNNNAFKELTSNFDGNESQKLVQLLNQSRLNVKVPQE